MGEKSNYAEFAASSAAEPTIILLTADGGRIPAHNEVLRLVCSCLQNAPASDTWDLSSLLINDSEVSQQTLEAVLSVIYSSMGALNYEMDRTAGLYSLPQLLDMLLFADAVGCSKAVLGQLAGLLGGTVRPELEINFTGRDADSSSSSGGSSTEADRQGDSSADSKLVTLQLASVYSLDTFAVTRKNEYTSWFELRCLRGQHSAFLHKPSEQQVEQLLQQVSQQLEALLFVSFKLDLQQLLQPVLRFLRANSTSLFDRVIVHNTGAIFFQRVLAAAGGASGVELLSRGYVQQPLGVGFCDSSMLSDVEFDKAEHGATMSDVCFTATLVQDLHEYKKGTRVWTHLNKHGDMTLRDVHDDKAVPETKGDYVSDSTYLFGVVLGPLHSFKC